MGTHLARMALAPGGGRHERGCCPRRGGSKCDAQTLRYARTDSHMHAQGHPGRLKDRSCRTHPHGDKGKGRLLLHWGARRGGTHPRETDPCTYSCTGSHGDAVTRRGEEESLSHACMHTGQLLAATCYKRPCHSQAHTCSPDPVTQALSPAVTVAVTQSNAKRGYTSTHVYTM